jgi:hypothetical protein
MLEIIIIAFVFWLGYQLGQMVLSWHLRDIIRSEARKEGIKVDDEYNIIEDKKPRVSKLWAEKVHDVLYLYDIENTFICQADSIDGLAKLALKYKNIKYASVIINEEVYAFVDGSAKPASEILK